MKEIKWIPLEKCYPDWEINPESDEDFDYPRIGNFLFRWDENSPIKEIKTDFPIGMMFLTVDNKILIVGNINQSGGRCDCCSKNERVKSYSLSLIEEIEEIEEIDLKE